jgi:tetratricopeptide (TPR) repeat protein
MKRKFIFCLVSVLFLQKSIGSVSNFEIFNKEFVKSVLIQDFQFEEVKKQNQKDSILQIDYHIKESDKFKNKGLYAVAYEHLWKALILANEKKDGNKLITIHNEIGVLYGIYGQEKEAIRHKQLSLNYVKKQRNSIKGKRNNLARAYYSLAVQYRRAKEFDKALVYLDSSSSIGNRYVNNENPYVFAEKGTIFLKNGNLDEAEKLLLKSKSILEKNNRHYLVIVYSFLGDLYQRKNEIDNSIKYYEKSLKSMSVFNSHTDLKTDILQKTASLYREKKDLKKAYVYLNESTIIADSLFGMRNENNSQLFEIKNNFKETIEIQDKKINKQQLVLEKKKRIQIGLILVIIIVVFVFVIAVFINYHKAKVQKLKIEKESTAIKISHEKEKLNAVLETKSKELTVSALQLIDKDKNIDMLLDELKKNAPESYSNIKNDIVRGNKDLWQSFNLRFTEVNTDFYKRLLQKHETLTQTEQKHCALIKLKFDSKEMARLLNISISSVHISRHRIRKKIGLNRDEDLGAYIATI